jgi:predicted nicotinamide N-methyase
MAKPLTLTAATTFIARHLTPTPVEGGAGLMIYRAHPTSGLSRLDPSGDQAPYWAYPWGGGLVLMRHLLAHPGLVQGRRVLDLGAGSGLVGLTAARLGPASVACNDIALPAQAAIALNAALNAVTLTILPQDLLDSPLLPDIDLVLVGDLFYAPDLAARVLAYLRRCQAAGQYVLIGDPGRADLPLADLTPLAQHDVHDFGTSAQGPPRAATVFTLT